MKKWIFISKNENRQPQTAFSTIPSEATAPKSGKGECAFMKKRLLACFRLLLLEDTEPSRLIISKRGRMVEGAGMYPHPLCTAPSPRRSDSMAQERSAEATPQELRCQPEVAYLCVTAIGAIELVIASYRTTVIGNPGTVAILFDECLPVRNPPGVKIAPLPRCAYQLVQKPIEFRLRHFTFNDLEFVRLWFFLQLGCRDHFQIISGARPFHRRLPTLQASYWCET